MSHAPSAVGLGILRDLLTSICEEMATLLERSAYSVNIKERRDHSTAIFDGRGLCLVCGDHMPVHLGSLPAAVESVLGTLTLHEGDIAMVNDPYHGGTHLPDITLVAAAPIRARRGTSPRPTGARCYVAVRAHQADVGGMTPGSMPLATEIYQEGIVIPPLYLERKGSLDENVLALVLANVRTPDERRGDLLAMRAALSLGVRRLSELACRTGPRLATDLPYLISYTERATRALVATLPRGRISCVDALDDDGVSGRPVPIAVTLDRRGSRLRVDFSRSAPQTEGSVNCSRAVTLSAVAYVLRCMLRADVPMNAGTLACVDVVTRPGTVVDARPPAAVCGGNVETSQRIVDVLLRAFARMARRARSGGGRAPALREGIPAASQGTMNNVAIGGATRDGQPFAYYETIGGGAGASARRCGQDAVHTHMTNSRNTPVETLERLYPIRIGRYAVRRGSGGRGARRGGDGIVRSYELLAPATVTLLTDRRRTAPYGLSGGRPGARGRNLLLRRGARRPTILPGKMTLSLAKGDVLSVETPGGGGHGRKPRRTPHRSRRL